MEDLVKKPKGLHPSLSQWESWAGWPEKPRGHGVMWSCGLWCNSYRDCRVGQIETAVHSMTDFFLLLKLAGAGDELQGIKRGIMEMADAIVINKADGENNEGGKTGTSQIQPSLHLYLKKKVDGPQRPSPAPPWKWRHPRSVGTHWNVCEGVKKTATSNKTQRAEPVLVENKPSRPIERSILRQSQGKKRWNNNCNYFPKTRPPLLKRRRSCCPLLNKLLPKPLHLSFQTFF